MSRTATVKAHWSVCIAEIQGDGDLVRLLLIRANEQKAGMQLDRPRRFSALPIMPLDMERSKSFADWPQDQHDFWMYRLGNMALVQGPEQIVGQVQ